MDRISEAQLTRQGQHYLASGSWTIPHIASVHLDPPPDPPSEAIKVDFSAVVALDTAGAWLLHRELGTLEKRGYRLEISGLRPEFVALYDRVRASSEKLSKTAGVPRDGFLTRLGRATVDLVAQTAAFLSFVGEIALSLLPLAIRPLRLRWRLVLNNVQSAGVDALPIVGLLALLMGVVIAYQGAIPLSQYGANIYIADLVGLAMLRELAPMITAIIVAGRTGASYTAEIGSMKINEEIDALKVMGIAPMEMLVIPKLVALVLVLPLLTLFADFLGVLGGMVMAQMVLDVGPEAFIEEFLIAVDVQSLLIGLGKAPVFAAIIAAVGCFQGFQAAGSAESVGQRTTASVVQSIFLIIVIDAAFSVAFSALGI